MPEGDTIYRTAEVLRRALEGDVVVAARGRPGGAQLERVIGRRVSGIDTRGKHLLIDFDSGLTLHTHLRMNGAWHRYRPGERWKADPSAAVAVIETDRTVAVCFEAPTVELMERRAVALHPVLSRLGPDLLDSSFDFDLAYERLHAPDRDALTIAEALLDQNVVAGIGNVYRSEILFIERTDPFAPARSIGRADAQRLIESAIGLLRANLDGGERITMPDASGASPGSRVGRRNPRKWVYARTGRPCWRCGHSIRATRIGDLPRRLYWCPTCQRRGHDRADR